MLLSSLSYFLFLIFHFLFLILLCVLCAYVFRMFIFLFHNPTKSILLLFNHQPVIGHPVVELLNDGLLKLKLFGQINCAHQVVL